MRHPIYHMLAPAILSTSRLVDGGPPPPFTAAEQLASPKDIT